MIKNIQILPITLKRLVVCAMLVLAFFTSRLNAQGVDAVFFLDNSNSIDNTEWNNMSASTRALIDKVLACNSNNRVSVANFGGIASVPRVFDDAKTYIESDFSNDPALAKAFIRRFGTGGSSGVSSGNTFAYENTVLLNNALSTAIAMNGINSPQKKLTRNVNNKLVIFLFTDALREDTSGQGGGLIRQFGTGGPFDIYNQMKSTLGATFVVIHAPSGGPAGSDDVARPAAVAIASVGGSYNGAVEANAGDPQGSGVKPRKAVMSGIFNISSIDIETIVDNICRSCAPTVAINSVTPPAQNVCLNGTALSVVADAVGTGTLSYQWYSNTTNSTTGGTVISGQTSATFNPPTSVAGTKYYYVIVSDSYCEGKSTSSIVAVTVVNSAGTTAPTVQNISYSCPSTFANLNTAHVGSIPSGVSLVWFTNNVHSGIALTGTQITEATAGTYYAFYYSTTGGCYSPSATVIITNTTTLDNDGDGIPDACDLDNDNDGILDTNECVNPIGAAVIWSGDGTYGLNPQILQSSVIANSGTTAASMGSGLSSITIFMSSYQLSGISPSTTALSGAIAENDYVEYQFKTANWNVSAPNSLQYVFDRTSVFHQSVNPIDYKFAVAISADNFATSTVLLSDLSSRKNNAIQVYKNPDYALEPNKQYKVRVYFYSLASSGAILFDNFTIRVTQYCDTDGDGIPDYLDLDSDNDGCLDAIEGAGGFTASDLSNASGTVKVGLGSSASNQNFGTAVDTNGVPTLVGASGQGVGDSKNALLSSQCAEICTEIVNGNLFEWSYTDSSAPSNPVLYSISNQPASNYGYSFDIYNLDNSLNMIINGVPISTNELEFQSIFADSQNISQNIEFLDGTHWEDGTIPAIYQLYGDPVLGRPIVKINISPNGSVSVLASKVSADHMDYQLFPVRFKDGSSFNIVSWNTLSTNQVSVSQNVIGDTSIKGFGYGRKIIPCLCYKPAATAGTALVTKQGITSLGRAGADQNDNWPMVRKGAWTALESKTKGFVVNRIPTTSEVNAIPNPVEGMMVYDEEEDCLKIYTIKDGSSSAAWYCMNTQTCPST